MELITNPAYIEHGAQIVGNVDEELEQVQSEGGPDVQVPLDPTRSKTREPLA